MTAPGSFVEMLAAHLAGPATGDAYSDALRAALLGSAACIAEMNSTGFDTNNAFNVAFLDRHADEKAFRVNSAGKTGAVYLMVGQGWNGDALRVAVQVYNPKQVGTSFYRMTLVRADNGNARAIPGW